MNGLSIDNINITQKKKTTLKAPSSKEFYTMKKKNQSN